MSFAFSYYCLELQHEVHSSVYHINNTYQSKISRGILLSLVAYQGALSSRFSLMGQTITGIVKDVGFKVNSIFRNSL